MIWWFSENLGEIIGAVTAAGVLAAAWYARLSYIELHKVKPPHIEPTFSKSQHDWQRLQMRFINSGVEAWTALDAYLLSPRRGVMIAERTERGEMGESIPMLPTEIPTDASRHVPLQYYVERASEARSGGRSGIQTVTLLIRTKGGEAIGRVKVRVQMQCRDAAMTRRTIKVRAALS